MRFRIVPGAIAVLALAAAVQAGDVDEVFPYDAQAPAAGRWVGTVELADSTQHALLDVKRADDAWSARLTMLTAMILDREPETFDAAGHDVRFTMRLRGKVNTFTGTISEDGQKLDGRFTAPAEGDEAVMVERTAAFRRIPYVLGLEEPKSFTGELELPGGFKLGMTVTMAKSPGGNWFAALDVPMQSLRQQPLIDVALEDAEFRATLPSLPPAVFQMTVDDSWTTLTGTFAQGPLALPLEMEVDADYTGELRRPQHPVPPYPYEAREVTVAHPAGHTLAGTLTIPSGSGPFPAAILITGSGPQDRDESLMGHKPFLVIADHLTRHGIAVLRCDDRGTGASTGQFGGATSADFATDVAAQVDFLKTVEQIRDDRIGLIGHSEGGLIAPIVAVEREEDVAFIVLMAGTGVRGDDLLRVQSRLLLESGGADEQTIAEAVAQQDVIFRMMLENASAEELKEIARPFVEQQLAALGLDKETAEQMIDAQVEQLASPWLRHFITYDPRPTLAKVRCPVLALNGTLDLQVWHEQNLPAIEQAVSEGGGRVTIRRYEGFNHLFQPATTGSIAEYATIETTFDEAVLADIVDWIELVVEGEG